MKAKFYLFLFCTIFLAVNSCKDVEEPDLPPVTKDPGDPTVDPEPGISEFPTMPVTVKILEGMNANLEGAMLYSGIIGQPVQANGSSKATVKDGEFTLAFLTDSEDKLMMMGFLGNGKTEISAQSTAEALLYLGAGLYVYGNKVKEKYLTESGSLEELSQLTSDVENKLKTNPFALDQGLFEPELRAVIEKLGESGETVDIRARVINTEPDIKSGLQVSDKDFQSITITNRFRRRAHAFLYKESFKDRDRKQTILIRQSEYSGQLQAKSDHKVDPIINIDGFLGSLKNVVKQGGMKFAVMETDPINIPLETDESQAIYKVRVVGPVWGKTTFAMTREEEKKAIDLTWKTTFYDLVWPAISELTGGFADVIKEDSEELAKVFSHLGGLIGKMESIDEFSRYGDLKKFSLEMLDFIVGTKADEVMKDNLEKLLIKAYKIKYGTSGPDLEDFTKKGAARALKVADLGLKAINAAWLGIDVNRANMVEIFKVEANDIPFKLEPKDAAVSVNEQKELTITKLGQLPNNQTYWIKWWTTGEYGVMRDKEGRTGKEIETNFTKIFYRAISNPSNVDEEAEDKIYAEVFIREGENLTSIGLDSVSIIVKPIKLEIKPNGTTLSPVNGGTNEIKLYVETAGSAKKLENTDEFEYRYEWGTKGDYGLFGGYSVTENTMDNLVRYVALDEEVEKAEEEIFVRVYRLEKGTTEEKFYGEAKAIVKIENDENWKIIYVPLQATTVSNPCDGCFTNWLNASFPKKDNHESYTVRFFGFKKTAIPSVEGRTHTWKADQEVPRNIDFSRHTSVPDNRIGVWVLNNAGGKGHNPNLLNALKAFGGMIEVKIKLK
ncbi:hypothetical protein [Mongoliitalea daihaiensis]|uniref:hypothetical protein n=1 Tax=Mongoliitalea daihaiensis TaxID=2782006 RepID=UPI001F4877CA|nr:hypothetical protein [Mongoliitalea daihaiensis]UJP65909.1 hypothetical protein IPZ59_04610 [Mongoliitalea daihaiensis]